MPRKQKKSRYIHSRVSHLYLDTFTNIYYARARNSLGKDVWRSLETGSFEVAKTLLPGKVAEIQAGSASRSSNLRTMQTFGEVAEVYRGRIKATVDCKPSQITYRLQTLDALLRSWPALSSAGLGSITVDQCLAWAASYKKTISANRFNNTVGTLRHIFELGREFGLIVDNPAERIGKVKVKPKKLELPSREEFHRLIQTMREAKHRHSQEGADLVEFLAYAGCRIDEARNVRWRDIIDGKTIHIYGNEVTATKNLLYRPIPLLPPMRNLLDRLSFRYKQPGVRLRRGIEYVLQALECPKSLATACKKIGIKKLTHHDLRHLFATRCIETGVDIPTVSRWLGHKDGGALAMKTYGHLRDEHSQAMAAKVTF